MDTVISKLTLEEKAALLQGWTNWTSCAVAHLGIPSIFMADGPHGMRKQAGTGDHLGINASVPATCFPTAAGMANSWDPALGEEVGRALGREAAASNVHVVLGPGLNMKRSPLCGRNFEYFSEDPYLAGKLAAAYIRGIQENGPGACAKHFAVNSQELRRMAMDAVVDERTLREIYLTGFEIAVKEGKPKAIMSSYNMVNGVYANENPHLLQKILRQEWGFDGYVVSDWGADNDHVEGVRAGSNLVMPNPGPDCALGLVEAVKAGRIEESVLDARIEEFLKVVFAVHESVGKQPKEFDAQQHHALARRCAEAAIVLLENDGILPLKPDASVAIIGDFAKMPRYQGAGSSQVNPTMLDNFYDQAVTSGMHVAGFAQGFDRRDPNPRQDLIEQAVALAKKAETVLLCVGLDEIAESEGWDRWDMLLSKSQYALMDAVTAVNQNVVLVLSGGSPFVMPDCHYRAAIHGYLGGQAGAGAMVDALLGKFSPSGKLNETWPLALEDNPSHPYFPSPERTAEHREGLFIGYRYYDTANVPVQYPFGYGLSYTHFAYSDLQVTRQAVSFTITNTGSVAGGEIAQVYVGCPAGKLFRPKKELKGFAKVFLQPGESQRVTVQLDDKAFRYFNVKTDRFEVETADYTVYVAASVADVRLQESVHVQGTDAPLPYGALPSYESGRIHEVCDEEFAALLGHPIPDGHWQEGPLQSNDAFCQLKDAKGKAGRTVYRILENKRLKSQATGIPDLNSHFVYNMPFRAVAKLTGGWVSARMVEDLLDIFNGHFWHGLGKLIVDFPRNRIQGNRFKKRLKG